MQRRDQLRASALIDTTGPGDTNVMTAPHAPSPSTAVSVDT